MFASVFFAIVVAAFTMATPLDRRNSCAPNFQGAGLAIVNHAGEWTPSSLVAGSDIHTTQVGTFAPGFRIEQDGQYPTGHLIKALHVPANDLVVSSATGSLTLQTINANDRNQDFIIACNSCGGVSTGCEFRSAASGQCVQSSYTGVLFFADCNGVDGQSFTVDTISPA